MREKVEKIVGEIICVALWAGAITLALCAVLAVILGILSGIIDRGLRDAFVCVSIGLAMGWCSYTMFGWALSCKG